MRCHNPAGLAGIAITAAILATTSIGCLGDSQENTGSIGMELQIAPGVTINTVNWTITNATTGFGRTGLVTCPVQQHDPVPDRRYPGGRRLHDRAHRDLGRWRLHVQRHGGLQRDRRDDDLGRPHPQLLDGAGRPGHDRRDRHDADLRQPRFARRLAARDRGQHARSRCRPPARRARCPRRSPGRRPPARSTTRRAPRRRSPARSTPGPVTITRDRVPERGDVQHRHHAERDRHLRYAQPDVHQRLRDASSACGAPVATSRAAAASPSACST